MGVTWSSPDWEVTDNISQIQHILGEDADRVPVALARAINATLEQIDTYLEQMALRGRMHGWNRTHAHRRTKVTWANIYSLQGLFQGDAPPFYRRRRRRMFRGYIAYPAATRGTTYLTLSRISKVQVDRMPPGQMLKNRKEYFMGTVKGIHGIWKRTGEKDARGWPRPHLNLQYVLIPKDATSRLKRRKRRPPVVITANKAKQWLTENVQTNWNDLLVKR